MRKSFVTLLLALVCQAALATETVPIRGTVVSPADKHILYTGRISFSNPERPAWNFPGIQIVAAFEGTSLKMIAKPQSGYFMAQIDKAEPFKVAFTGKKDSVVTLATALPEGRHLVRLMYVIEGYEFYPEFWGFVLDEGRWLVEAPALPSRKLEFIGNSITCGYGNEGTNKEEHFDYATENHYYSYASLTARALEAQHWVVARSAPICSCSMNIRAMRLIRNCVGRVVSTVSDGTSRAISPMWSASTSAPTTSLPITTT